MMKFYHATTHENMEQIVASKKIKKSWDGVVYLCDTDMDACKFLVIRGVMAMSVIEVELDEKEVRESSDHSEKFFQCKAYIHKGDIELTGEEKVTDYTFNF